MSEGRDKKERSSELEKPATNSANIDSVFPPFPDPDDLLDFDDDISKDEKQYYKKKIPDIRAVVTYKLHCSACDRHIGSSQKNEALIKVHPMLRTLICSTCNTFYNSGEFDKGDDGSELYCRWCGQGGQVYCCCDCPHVFCAKCIKRNLGVAKIKEIESTDDWKCFKCNPNCLWDLRALCWALLRYSALKNKVTEETQDPRLKEEYLKNSAIDFSDCCKNKRRSIKKKEEPKKESENTIKNVSPKNANLFAKIPPTIQVKKFASLAPEDTKNEKKVKKRPFEQPNIIRNPIPIAPVSKQFNSLSTPPKRPRLMNPGSMPHIRLLERPQMRAYTPRFSPRSSFMPMPMLTFNGLANSYNNYVHNDNINLSLDSLTQGLDMAAMNPANGNDDLVCTPDLPPLEPVCEVTEDNTDDDVQCISPAPAAKTSRIQARKTISNLSSDNIIQMTENDVTVNKVTGGLKFRIDPQTLSSNKMYRLPDGRVFAITANPSMPAGYSATIVAVTENKPKSTPNTKKNVVKPQNASKINKRPNSGPANSPNARKTPNYSNRTCDLHVPVEWFRYNLIDAVDALDYSQTRLKKLKKESNTMFLRTRTVDEMKKIHKQFENLLNTSITRFTEIKTQINEEFKAFLSRKAGDFTGSEDEGDDDDVEILPNNDDPIFIDENSVDSVCNDTPDVDLTANTSDCNISLAKERSENETDKVENEQNDNTLNDSTTVINSSKSSNEMDKNLNDDEGDKQPEEIQDHNIDSNVVNEKSEMESDESKTEEKDPSDTPADTVTETINNQEVTQNSNDNLEDTPENDKLNDNTKDLDENTSENAEENLNQSMEVDPNPKQTKEQDEGQEPVMSDDLIADLLKDDTCDAVTTFNNDVDLGDLE